MKKIFARSAHNYDRNQASLKAGLKCQDKTLAQQQFAEECDINTIVERFHLTGEMPHVAKLPSFDDFTGIFDFQTAMNAIRAADETFMSLPAKLRARFQNDPQQFVAFCDDDSNIDEARKMGLLATPLPDAQPEPNLELPKPQTQKKQEPTPKPPKGAKTDPED